MRNFELCIILIALLAVQPACAQEIVTVPLQPPAATTSPASSPGILAQGTEIRLVLLNTISSATADKGQPVHLAVAQDVGVNGAMAIPRGTPAEGIVAWVRKGVPGKRDGALRLEARTILLPNGTKLKLSRDPDNCAVNAACWVFYGWMGVVEAIFLPIELPQLAIHSIQHKDHPNHHRFEGLDVSREACRIGSAYTAHKLKISTVHAPTGASTTEDTLKMLEACAAH